MTMQRDNRKSTDDIDFSGPLTQVEFLHLILDHISDKLVVVNTDGIIVLINAPYCDLLQGTPSDFIGKHITELAGPGTKLHLVAQGKAIQVGYPLSIRGHKLVTKQVPVRHGGEIIGAVGFALFSDFDKLKSTYSRVFDKELSLPKKQRKWLSQYKLSDIIGRGKVIDSYKDELERVAGFDVPVLITGETGSGKELAAHVIHSLSVKSTGPFVTVNCASIPNELIEAELFGYEAGAFTGASSKGKPGKFELATDGILFLDEIGDMPMGLQSSLLRVLQSNEIVRIGGTGPVPINVRVICATNRSLEDQVRRGLFRADLYYRINVLNINIPALRHREDIIFLAEIIYKKISEKFEKYNNKLTSEHKKNLLSHSWPGNIRELQNCLIKLAVNDVLEFSCIENISDNSNKSEAILKNRQIIFTNHEIQTALAEVGYNKTKAAKSLGISRSYLYRLIKQMPS